MRGSCLDMVGGMSQPLVLSLFPGIGLLQAIPNGRPGGVKPTGNLVDREALFAQSGYDRACDVKSFAGRMAAPLLVVLAMALPAHARVVASILIPTCEVSPIVPPARIRGAALLTFSGRAPLGVEPQVKRLVTGAIPFPEVVIAAGLGMTDHGRSCIYAVVSHQTPDNPLSQAERRRDLVLRHSGRIQTLDGSNHLSGIGLRRARPPWIDALWHTANITSQYRGRKRVFV